ncbi:MAG TPA: Rieske 2Fe-2S domain-containing protein [Pirellulales bacterium]|jgi:Rieske Fe-S protein|nr:Rieske 2Fe-2S domain-containing protein [Pirellulales bacterium]
MTKTTEDRSELEVKPRRVFLKLLTALLGAIATAAIAIPGFGYLAAAVARRKEQPWISLGPVSAFPPGETRLKVIKPSDNPLAQPWDGITAQTGVYVRYLGRDESYQDQFNVFAINCTHLGCPVEWFPQSGLFMCPCHGGVYYENGDRASGPPPRGLYLCVWKVKQDANATEPHLFIQAPFLPTLQHTLTDKG